MARWIAFLLLLLVAAAGLPAAERPVSLLIYPVADGAGVPASLPPAMSKALALALQEVAAPTVRLTVFDPTAPSVRRLLRERPYLEEQDLLTGSPAFVYVLGQELGYDAALVCDLAVDGSGVLFSARLISVRNREMRTYAAGAAEALPERTGERWAWELARRLLSGLTPQFPTDLRAALAVPPATVDDYRRRGQELFRQGRYYEAIHEYDRALALDPRLVDCYVEQGRCYIQVGEARPASLQLHHALALDPHNVPAQVLLADLDLAAGKPERALERYRQAAAGPDYLPALVGEARALAALGKDDEALPRYERLAADNGTDPVLLGALAQIYQRLGRDGEAVARYQELLRLEPGNQSAREQLIALYVRQNRLAEAVGEYRLAFQAARTPVTYRAQDYARLAATFDREADQVRTQVLQLWHSYHTGNLARPQVVADMDRYYQRSESLARALQFVLPPETAKAGHNYRVFAYSLLNQSDFELQAFLQTRDSHRYDRGIMLRDAAGTALAHAQALEGRAGSPAP